MFRHGWKMFRADRRTLALDVANALPCRGPIRAEQEMPTATSSPSIEPHFAGKADAVRETYDAILHYARQLGTFEEQAKKTSIHLARRAAFAGVATRKDALILTIKSNANVSDSRIHKIEQVSANRWHLEVRLTAPDQVDAQVREWLKVAYQLAG
jgi:hypothetical protein